ncbi:substrate-binding domain-containing protein [Rhodospirillum rubrum]|uniref:Ribose ABC transporter, periplasmic binding protein n=1 Tax=Rhodospirillum rubrum (strain ATCC 11170 / ATH 1.1.1 / DSM 467 / LMG 4362 / NCIMB 8255 / S1) TaxID=269796 RepID=Q2RUM9_RHORT|nr:substrate-binding domain-containing protein [Rhodospirillum rubrum]ABC22166.1 ribose ABC transporter, periplasmic binding protein [Rhodospirillum rubrum ATCC 11170]AEO47880.1 ribose ABC transporter periplasmic binding protein [Rhodospirillum rubrum F11]MBK5953754.1 ribose ABC transporter substrate-binding protein [Rhodospirillum rubrum]QXG81814.1 substrate-binding domain-containing protein [Rhodospirillum rubrum]HAP98966.1 sugar ABC transporter substrate-binding protein [Rhodospirillum rubr
MKTVFVSVVAAMAISSLPMVASAQEKSTDPLRFVLVPKVVHPWFDKVNDGAKAAAEMLTTTTGRKVTVEYRAPQKADVVEQNDIIARSIATRPDGIFVDLLDEKGNRAVLEEAQEQGIPVTVFDSVAPEGMNLTSIGNDFCEQATIASTRLVELMGGKGEVAIMMGVPTAPNHAIRAKCHEQTFAKYPDIKLVATGIDNDSIETAQKQAAAIMQAHPNLKGWVASDAAGPIGIGQAIKEAGKVGKVFEVGLDDLPDLLALIKEGVVDSSSSTKPEMQGYWAVIATWQKAMGMPTPKYIDTGIAVITKESLAK